MAYIDTRDLQKRLDELTELKDAIKLAENELEDAKESRSAAESEAGTKRAEEDIEDKEADLEAAKDAFGSDEQDELNELENLESEISEFRSGETMIPVNDFEEYTQEMLEDCGDIPKNLPGYIVIDWEQTANNIKVDYTEVTYQGEEYLVRAS
jgi:chromosome segregation ATPase